MPYLRLLKAEESELPLKLNKHFHLSFRFCYKIPKNFDCCFPIFEYYICEKKS